MSQAISERAPLPTDRAHAAQRDRRRGVSGGLAAAHRTPTVRAVRGQPLYRPRSPSSAARGQPGRVATASGHPSGSPAGIEFICAGRDVDRRPARVRRGCAADHRIQRDGDHRRRPRRSDRAGARRPVAIGARLSAGRRRVGAPVPNRVLHQPHLRRGRQAAATPHRADLSVDRGPVRRRASPSYTRRSPRYSFPPNWPTDSASTAGTAALQMRRSYKTSDGEMAQLTINTHLSSNFRYAMTMRRVTGQAAD